MVVRRKRDRQIGRAWTGITRRDYHVVMKAVGIADLKARLSEHLRSVRKGRTLTVLDRGTPVARIVPCVPEPVEVRRAVRRLSDLERPPPPAKPTDSVAVLIDDRSRR
jgi:prevent-host-death family protein